LLTDRLNKFPSVLIFLTLYFCLFTAVSLVTPGAVAEMFRPPFVQAALFMAFFMLTDPPTSPNRYRDQVWYGAVVAVVACAAQLLGAAEALREVIDSSMTTIEQAEYEREVSILRSKMNEVDLEKAWNEGRGMTMDEAIENALRG